MSNENTIENETLDIVDLEYDVGGMGAEETGDCAASHEGFVVVMVIPK